MIRLNNTDLEVSPICLGTGNYGGSIPEAEAFEQLSEYLRLGGNFIDTAHVYGVWNEDPKKLSECVIGRWLGQNGNREQVIISSKGGHPHLDAMHISRLSRGELENDLDDSLQRLNTDYIDLYFLHRDDPNRPVEEIVDYLEAQVRSGKIRYYGCSNWTLPRIAAADAYARNNGQQGFSCNQLMWSLANINADELPDQTCVPMDQETYQYHQQTGLNAMAYTSAANGYFSRRLTGKPLTRQVQNIYTNPVNEDIFELLVKHKCDSAAVAGYALSYFSQHCFTAIPIVSFSRIGQLRESFQGLAMNLDKKLMQQLISRRQKDWEKVFIDNYLTK